MALDILDHDSPVIDQNANRQRKAAESHGVEGLPSGDKCRERRK